MPIIDLVCSEFIDTKYLVVIIRFFQKGWVNKYDPGDSQEIWNICDSQCNLSMVYFHTLNNDDGCQFKFCNTDYAFIRCARSQ